MHLGAGVIDGLVGKEAACPFLECGERAGERVTEALPSYAGLLLAESLRKFCPIEARIVAEAMSRRGEGKPALRKRLRAGLRRGLRRRVRKREPQA
jgi:hypothetical protein